MPFQQVPNTASIEVRFSIGGQDVENIFYAKKNTPYTESEIVALANAVDEWVSVELMEHLSGNITYRETHVRGLNDATDLQHTADDFRGAVGLGGGGLPANVAKAITLSSGLTGRNARGRVFLSGMTSAGLADIGHFSQGYVDGLLEALDALKVIIQGLGWLWVIVSRYKDGAPRAVAETYLITSIGTSNLTTDSMRGRLPKS